MDLLDKAKDAVEEKKSSKDDGSEDELEQDDWKAEDGGQAKKKEESEADKKKKEEKTKNRKKDTATINAGGDFQVQCHIIEGRDLTGKDSGGTSDPVVTITIFDKKKSTKIISKTKNPRWDQVLYFELNGLEPDELSRGKALIQVYDADVISRNDLIGSFEFDLAWIYYRDHHEVYNQWIGLTNTEETEEDVDDDEEEKEEDGIDGIEGYLKLSITILGTGDEQYIHDEEEELAKEEKLEAGMILISPGIEQTPHLLTIKIYECRELTKTDDDTIFTKMRGNTGSANLDPFFYVEYAGVRLRSKKYAGVSPKTQVEFRIPVMEPVFSKSITITVMDYDALSRNDRIGCLKIDYLKLKKDYNMNMEPCWQYLYGAPRGEQAGYARKMNKGLVEGSNFRGMIFMEANVQVVEKKPRKKVIENINSILDKDMPKMVEYYLRADIYEGTEINKIKGFGDEMFVQVEICEKKARSSSKKISDKNSTVKWYESLISDGCKDKCIGPFLLPDKWEQDPEPVVLPDVFIYLCVKEFGGDIEQVSYCRVPLNKIIPGATKRGTPKFTPGKKRMWDNGPRWFDMKENLALDKYKDNVFPGALLIGLNAGPKADLRDEDEKLRPIPALSRPFSHEDLFKAVPTDATPEPPDPDEKQDDFDLLSGGTNESSPPQKKEKKQQTRANVTIKCIEACRLPAMDGGLFTRKPNSDPYVEIVIESQKTKKKREKETEPVKKNLNPKWNQELTFDNIEVGDEMYIRVLDWDAGPDPDDEMANLKPMALTGTDFNGKWFELIPSKEAEKKYKKKKDKLQGMKIKLDITYDWDVVEETEKKKKGLFKSISKTFKKKKKKEANVDKLSEPERRKMELRVHCYQARNLENADMSGLSDGYMVVRFCGRSDKTRVIEDAIDPKWYQSLYLSVDVPIPINYAPRIYCEIYDHDDIGKDQSLGRFSVAADDIWKVFKDSNDNKVDDSEEDEDGLDPQWYSLEDAEGNQVTGTVLVSFQLIDIKQASFKRPNITPSFNRHRWLNIHTLGLRDIQSTFGCNKPFVQFEMNGSLYKTEKSNQPSSRNPNFCQILKFEVRLPDKDIFLPNLNLTIKDSLFGGLIKRKLGYASVEVERLITSEAAEEFKYTQDQLEQKAIREAAKEELAAIQEEKEQKQGPMIKALHSSLNTYNKNNADPQTKKYIKKHINNDDDNYNTDYLEEEKGGGQAGDVVIAFSTDSGVEDSPLLKNGGAGNAGGGTTTTTNTHDQYVKDQKHKAKEEGHYSAYEWMKKNTYDLTKTQPDYMKDRDMYDDELEDKMPLKPFLQIPFFTGKDMRTVGFFKGLISFNKDKKASPNSNFKYLKEITKPVDLYLRLYILNGMKLIPRDSGGGADPYLIVKIGKEKFSTRNDYHEDTLEPEFYHTFEIPVVMPGPAKVEIQVWDWDGIGDDLIGTTCVDIEDRWYSKEWRDMDKKPVETRTLWSDQSTVSQGKLSMWMEMLTPSDAKKYPPIDIKPPPQDEYELRVIVWECKDCPIMDTVTNMNDLYITGEIASTVEDENDLQQTDLHFRSQNGCGSFNWRMKFPIKLPKRKLAEYPRFQTQIWDKDFFSPNDNIAEATIDLQPFLRYCEKWSKDKRCVLEYNEEDEFWIDLGKGSGGQGGGKGGKIKLSFELLPLRIAKMLPAGFGRDKPNQNPHLPEPVGRAKFSLLNPCTSLRNLLGDRLCCKIILIFCCLICIALLIFITPNLISAITANLVTG